MHVTELSPQSEIKSVLSNSATMILQPELSHPTMEAHVLVRDMLGRTRCSLPPTQRLLVDAEMKRHHTAPYYTRQS